MRVALWILGGIAILCSVVILTVVVYSYIIISAFP